MLMDAFDFGSIKMWIAWKSKSTDKCPKIMSLTDRLPIRSAKFFGNQNFGYRLTPLVRALKFPDGPI